MTTFGQTTIELSAPTKPSLPFHFESLRRKSARQIRHFHALCVDLFRFCGLYPIYANLGGAAGAAAAIRRGSCNIF